MSDDKFEFIDPETGETHPINGTSLVSNVRDVFMSRRKMQVQAKTWADLTEADQQDEITAMQELARDLVGKVVEVVAEKGMICAHVAISKFAVDVDKGEVVITSKGFASDEMLTDLAHAKGKVAKLTVVDEGQFNQKSTLLVPDPDQPEMSLDSDINDMSQAEIDDAAQEMDGDDLHGDRTKEYTGGFQSRMAGYHSQRNPFDIDTVGREEWYLGWCDADVQDDAPEVDESLGVEDAETVDEATAPVEIDAAPSDGVGTPEFVEGQQARLKGLSIDANTHDPKTDGHSYWKDGYIAANVEVNKIIDEGREAGVAGRAKTSCDYKKKTDGERFWLEGWEDGNAERIAEDVAAEGIDTPED